MSVVIDWTSDETSLLLNPRMPAQESERLQKLVASGPDLPGHVWLATSGTSGSLKLVALSKRAILASAKSVNRHLEATPEDVWCRVLPAFHAGGLGIVARAYVSGSRVVSADWDAREFVKIAERERVTLTALVPAQVRDLVREQLRAPRAFRAIVVGGGAMPDDLYEAARDLGWPVLPSYGLTETASQVATATRESPDMHVLGHLVVRIDDGLIEVRGASLLTGYAMLDSHGPPVFADPKVDGWFITEDRGELIGDVLRVFGRAGEFVKVGGESVDLKRLDLVLDSVRGNIDAAVIAIPDERLGLVIHLASTGEADGVVEAFNARVHPFERIRATHRVDTIPRSPLGKLLRSKLAGLINLLVLIGALI